MASVATPPAAAVSPPATSASSSESLSRPPSPATPPHSLVGTSFDVLAVSKSTPRWESMTGGRKVRSAIVRKPSPTPITFRPGVGVEGHESAVHDGEVYVFFTHHYAYWRERLQVPEGAWNWCHWGENLTIDAPDHFNEHNIRLGDVWELGDSDTHPAHRVRLQVCGARVPCYRLAWRLGQPDAWLKELAMTGFCGVYLRVLQGGTVGAGATGRVLHTRDEAPCMAAITQCAFEDDTPAVRDRITWLLAEDGMVQMNRGVLEAKQKMFRDADQRKQRGWQGWRPLRISRVERDSDDTKSFYLQSTDSSPLPAFIAGQFLTVRLPTGVRRCWSLSDWTADAAPAHYRLTIKSAGNASTWLHDADTRDLVVEASAPSGQFVADRQTLFATRQIYISAGIGITPLFAMMKAHLRDATLSKAPAVWIHVTRDGSTHLFRNQLPALPSNVQSIVFFTQPRPGIDVQGRDYDRAGRPDRQFFEELLTPMYELHPIQVKPVPFEGRLSHCYVCGPPAFESDIREYLTALRVPPPFIHSESFAVDDGPGELGDLEKATVRFRLSDREATWERAEPCSILEVAQKAGLDPPYGCSQGICGSCATKLAKGKVSRGVQDDGETVHVCVAYPTTDVVEVDL